MMTDYRYHVRSTSLPSASHPLTARVEEQLNKLRAWVTSTHTPQRTQVLQEEFCALIDLYESVEDLLQLPHTKQVLVHYRHENWVDMVLDGSLRLLDLSGTSREVLLQMKELVQETQSAFRRGRGREFNLGNEIDMYMFSRRKVKKKIHKCLANLKRMENKHVFSSLLDKDSELVAVVDVLRQVEDITLSVFESLLSFVSGSRTLQKPSGWSLVSKLIHNNRNACEERREDVNEVEKVDAALSALRGHKYCHDNQVSLVQDAKKWMEALEASIKGLEEGLERMFRLLIKTRVSLLNILNN